MYSNKILNFQESTTILNACTKKSGNLLTAPRILIRPLWLKLIALKNVFDNETVYSCQTELFEIELFFV